MEMKVEIDYKSRPILEERSFPVNLDKYTRLIFGKRMEDPYFSIVIPTYKRDKTLEIAVDSAINQDTEIPFEVVVLDNNDDENDHSTVNNLKNQFGNSSRLCYYKNMKNLGMTGNWNLGIQVARGEYLVILHDDDKIHRNYLSVMSAVLKERSNIGIISCFHKTIGDEDFDERMRATGDSEQLKCITYTDISLRSLYIGHDMHVCGLLFNRRKALQIGGFDDYWYPCSDYVFEVKMVEEFGGVLCREKLADYRILENESLRPEVSGRFPIVIYLAQSKLNRRYRFFPPFIANLYQEQFMQRYEEELIIQLCNSKNKADKLQNRFDYWRHEFNILRTGRRVFLYKALRTLKKVIDKLHTFKTCI